MADLDFPRKPSGTLQELWQAVLDLLPQLRRKVRKSITIGTSETPIEHGLGFAPQTFHLIPSTNVTWWETKSPDTKYVYVAASSATTASVEFVP